MYKCLKLGKNLVLDLGLFKAGFGLGLTCAFTSGKGYKSLSLSGVLLWWIWDVTLAYEAWQDDPDVLTFAPWEPGDD